MKNAKLYIVRVVVINDNDLSNFIQDELDFAVRAVTRPSALKYAMEQVPDKTWRIDSVEVLHEFDQKYVVGLQLNDMSF